jgi:amino acid transporter
VIVKGRLPQSGTTSPVSADDNTRSSYGEGLGTVSLVAQSLSAGPIAAAALLGGIVAAKGGSASVLYLLIVLIGVLGLGAVVAMFARRFTHAGVMYEYVGRSLGSAAGISTAGLYFLAYFVIGGPALVIGAGVMAQELCATYLNFSLPFWVFALAVLVIAATINICGVRPSVHAQLVIFVLSAIPYVFTAIVVMVKGGASGNTTAVFDPSAPTAGAFLPTFMFCVLFFVGVESSAALGEEARAPARTVPRAIFITIFVVAGFCALTQYAGAIGFGLGHVADRWGGDPLGLSTLGQVYLGSWIAPLLQLGLILDMVAVVIGFMAATTRGVAALAREGLLPTALTHTTRRHTPSIAIIVYTVATVLCVLPVAIYSATTGMNPFMGFTVGTTLGGLLVMSAYLMLTIAAAKMLLAGHFAPAGWIAVILAAATVGAALVGSIYPLPSDATRYGVYGAGVLLTVSLAWGCYHATARKRTLAVQPSAVLDAPSVPLDK